VGNQVFRKNKQENRKVKQKILLLRRSLMGPTVDGCYSHCIVLESKVLNSIKIMVKTWMKKS